MTDTRTTHIDASPTVPTITITREFDAPVDAVFRAFVEPDLYAAWIGPHSISTQIDQWNPTTGGFYRWSNWRDGEELASFYGSFHEVRTNERIVQTQTFEAFPDGVTLEIMTFEDLGEGRTRLVGTTVAESFDIRDGIIASGMSLGVTEGYEKLDALLAQK